MLFLINSWKTCYFFNTSRNPIPSNPRNLKNYVTGHRTANTIPLFVPVNKIFFGSILFQNKSQSKGNYLEATG